MKKSKLTELLDWIHEAKPQTVNEIKNEILSMMYQEKKSKVFEVPKMSEVITYFLINGYHQEAAIKAYEYYSAGDWYDSRGKKVMNWKLKMKSVWFKDEYKIKKAVNPKPFVGNFFEYADYEKALQEWEQQNSK